MASLARYYLCLATVTVTSDAVGILLQRSGGVMVAVGAFLRQNDMFGMIKFEWLIQLALTVQGNCIWNGYPPATLWNRSKQ